MFTHPDKMACRLDQAARRPKGSDDIQLCIQRIKASPLDGLLMRHIFLAFATRFFKNVVFKLIDRQRLFLNYVFE